MATNNNITTVHAACARCGKTDSNELRLKQCSRCQKVFYCSVDCQKSDWKRHKKAECNKAPKKAKKTDVSDFFKCLYVHFARTENSFTVLGKRGGESRPATAEELQQVAYPHKKISITPDMMGMFGIRLVHPHRRTFTAPNGQPHFTVQNLLDIMESFVPSKEEMQTTGMEYWYEGITKLPAGEHEFEAAFGWEQDMRS